MPEGDKKKKKSEKNSEVSCLLIKYAATMYCPIISGANTGTAYKKQKTGKRNHLPVNYNLISSDFYCIHRCFCLFSDGQRLH